MTLSGQKERRYLMAPLLSSSTSCTQKPGKERSCRGGGWEVGGKVIGKRQGQAGNDVRDGESIRDYGGGWLRYRDGKRGGGECVIGAVAHRETEGEGIGG